METAPRNCRFLSLVVVELVLSFGLNFMTSSLSFQVRHDARQVESPVSHMQEIIDGVLAQVCTNHAHLPCNYAEQGLGLGRQAG